MISIKDYLKLIKSEKVKRAVKIQAEILRYGRKFLEERGFIEILPVIISPLTDPLTDFRVRGEIECYGFKYQITKSMIFHKQISMLALPRIFSFSPNVRIEPAERARSGKHLIEFVQLDLEVRDASREKIMELGEELIVFILKKVKGNWQQDLDFFERELNLPHPPFAKITYNDALSDYGEDFETRLSSEIKEPVWIIDFPIEHREFYDREDSERPGLLKDMDLIYPEGYGEALSGGEREYEYEKIKKRIEQKGIDLAAYEILLKFAQEGLSPSAGFGIGVERLTRYICGLPHIEETRFFAKLPGKLGL